MAYIIKTGTLLRGYKMVNRFSKVFLGIFLIIMSLYLALIIDTHDLMNRAKKIFLGEILKHDIEDELIRYDLNGYSDEKM
jgi:hypothetical protein